MKQLIVLISTIVLGVAIAGIVLGFRGNAEKLRGYTNNQIESVFSGSAVN